MSFQKVDYEDHITVITASNLNAIQTQVLQNASDISTHAESTVRHVTQQEKDGWTAKYTKDASGIPKEHLTSTVQESLSKADSAYQKPQTNIPKTDLESTVQATLDYSDYLNVLFPIKLTSDQQGQGTYTANKTFAQIQDAYNAGKKPFAFMPRGQILPLVNRSNNVSYTFCGVDADSNVKMTVVIGAGDIITYTGGSYLVDYVYLITVTDDTPPTFDKTFSDIYSELTEGTKAVILRDYEKGYTYQVYSVSSSSIKFLRFSGDDWLEGYQISSNGTVVPYQHDYPLLNEKEDKDNKVTLITAQSTNAQYPSAKCVYDSLALKANQTSLDLTDRRVDALFKVNEGQTFDFDVDTATCYSATIPTGAVADSVTKIGGKSVVMNQLIDKNLESSTDKGITFTRTSDGIVANGTATGNAMYYVSTKGFNFVSGHKYLLCGCAIGGSQATYRIWVTSNSAFPIGHRLSDIGNGIILEANANETLTRYEVYIQILVGVTVNDIVFNPLLFDLTKMFGSGNEPTTVAQVKAMLPNDYYDYSAGEIVHAPVQSVVVKDDGAVVTDTIQIPYAIKSLTGYGWSAGMVCNEVDYANKKYIQRVGSRAYQSGDESNQNYVTDGTTTYYPLATPIETDISSYLDEGFLEAISCEGGGSVTFVSDTDDDYRLPIPNTNEFVVKLSNS